MSSLLFSTTLRSKISAIISYRMDAERDKKFGGTTERNLCMDDTMHDYDTWEGKAIEVERRQRLGGRVASASVVAMF
jgi:hypothetical protein